jgi:Family of unknown function (DUF6533)
VFENLIVSVYINRYPKTPLLPYLLTHPRIRLFFAHERSIVQHATVCVACQLVNAIVSISRTMTLLRFSLGNASTTTAYGSFRSRTKDVVLILDTVILFYDYLLTLPAEVDRFWHPRSHTWASTVFLANRYLALLGHIPLFIRVFEDPCKTEVSLIYLLFDYLSFAHP